jgi:hypothetical protein
MSKYVVDVVVNTEVATPVLSDIDILDAVQRTLDDLCPPFPGQPVAFRHHITQDPHDKHLVGIVFELDNTRLMNNGYIKR